MTTESSIEEVVKEEVITLDQVHIGMWVVIEHAKDNTLRHGFISKVHGENEQTKQIEVELFEGSNGHVFSIPDTEEITNERYIFYRNLIKNKKGKSPLHFKTQDFLVEKWTTFRSQPRETVFEKIVFITTETDPRYLVLDAEYHWESIVIDKDFIEQLKAIGATCVNIDSKYKLSISQLELIFNHFQ